MKTPFHVFVFSLLLLLIKAFPGKAQDITFNRVPLPGTSYSMTVAGVQDQQGYMWFANFGLHRYDGYNYISYFNDPLNPRSLGENRVEALCAGRNGFVWIGTYNAGLDRFDPATGAFTHFRHDPVNTSSLSNNTVLCILEDRDGYIWVGTMGGLNRFDPITQTFTRYLHNKSDLTSLSYNEVRSIYEDRQGTLWAGTGGSFEHNIENSGGLNRLNRKTNNFTRYMHKPNDNTSLADDRVRSIFEDSQGTFWVGTAGDDGLHTMDRTTGRFERHGFDPASPEALSRPPEKKNQLWADDHITFIIEDATAAVWIGTFGNGINRYDLKTKKVKHFPAFMDSISGAQQVTAWWACVSRDNILWIGYWEGLFRIDPLRKKIPYFATGRPVVALCEDAAGTVWYGGHAGLVRKDRVRGNEQRYVHDPHDPHSLSNNKVSAISEDREGTLWIATDNGLNCFDTRQFANSSPAPYTNDSISLPSIIITCLFEDRQGCLWIGTDKGLTRLNRNTGLITQYFHSVNDSNSLSSSDITCIYEDLAGNMWIGTWQGGLNCLSLKTGRIKRFIHGADINSLLEDKAGKFWAGTANGLYVGNNDLTNFLPFTRGPEIPKNIVITGLLEDDQKALWINSSRGILKLNPQRAEVFLYGDSYGVSTQSFNIGLERTGCHKGKSGAFYFGSGNGYYSFYPDQLKANSAPPQIVINEFRLNNEPVIPGEDSLSDLPILSGNQVTLRHDQNVFSFDFAAIHYSSPNENRHYFMLENLDNTWRKAGTEKTADYYNVSPGRYIFRVKAANSNGIWAEKKIIVIINPPWWRTWWAYLVAGVGLVLILWMLTWYRSRWLRAENILLEKKVINRTKELEQSLEERYKLSKKVESQQALLNERLRISRELHDDIGSTLGSISIYSEVAKKRAEKNENTSDVLTKIGLTSRDLINKISDIVWSLNPNNESFEQLQNRMMAFTAIMLPPQNILYDFTADVELKKLQLTAGQRKNIFLIYKEALYNIVKYADCKTVDITLSVQNNNFTMIIKDDGKGFDGTCSHVRETHPADEYLGGNGIENMNARADDMNAKLKIRSKIKEGTTVQLSLHV